VIKVSTWATVTSVTAVIIFTTVDTSAVLANCDDRANSDVCSSSDSIGKSYCSYYVYNNGNSGKYNNSGSLNNNSSNDNSKKCSSLIFIFWISTQDGAERDPFW
jgi:hypothetical protein